MSESRGQRVTDKGEWEEMWSERQSWHGTLLCKLGRECEFYPHWEDSWEAIGGE